MRSTPRGGDAPIALPGVVVGNFFVKFIGFGQWLEEETSSIGVFVHPVVVLKVLSRVVSKTPRRLTHRSCHVLPDASSLHLHLDLLVVSGGRPPPPPTHKT